MEELSEVLDPAAWDSANLAFSDAWLHTFTGRESAELVRAARDATGAEEAPEKPSLPALEPEIRKTAHELKSGFGFRILRGLPVRELGEQGAAPVFMALSRQLGRFMAGPGSVNLAHMNAEARDNRRPGFGGTAELPFHAHFGDVVGCLWAGPVSAGGTRKLASAVTVYNVMRAEYPDQLRILTRPFHMALHWPHPDHGHKWTLLPFLSAGNGLFNACAYRVPIERAQSLPGVPRLSAAQNRALAAFDDVADRVSVHVHLETGDIEYFNNHVALHTQARFAANGHGPGGHLVSVRLSMPGFRQLDAEHPISLEARLRRNEHGV